jgi:hypothetical protein
VSVVSVAGGRADRIEMFEIEHVDAALARFAELRPDPLRIPPNAASRIWERMVAVSEARDWEALRALCAPIAFDDRRPSFRISVDCEAFVANMEWVVETGFRPRSTLLATASDRLMLQRNVWTVHEGGHDSEVHALEVIEVDAEERIVAYVLFDPDDRRAASVEMLERFARSAVAPWLSTQLEALRSILEHDVERLRAALPEDFVFDDHRRVGPGRIEGRDVFIEWMTSLFEQSSDAIVEPLYFLAVEPHAALMVAHNFGTLADGGAFENIFVQIWSPDTVDVELFELDDLDSARARFEELRATVA